MEAALAQRLVSGLKQAGIDLVAYLPETRLSQILPLLRGDPTFTLVPVASESEAVTIGAGAALTGKQVAIYIEMTGFMFPATLWSRLRARYGVPLLLIVGYLGSMADQRNNTVYAVSGSYVEPLLHADRHFRFRCLKAANQLERRIADAVREMHALKLPVALLFTGEFSE
jgi:sulfopyruvate decarboxylase subunit alpha